MSRIALTGANGFLGWHTRSAGASLAHDVDPIAVGDKFDETRSSALLDGSDRLIHVAGVNRGTEDEVADGNVLFATQLAGALRTAATPPPIVVFANSSQAGNGSNYGSSKQQASDLLRSAAESVGSRYIDVRLPNLFGEHGRPFYNSVVATFSHLIADGAQPVIEVDRELTLLHAQDAADVLLGAVEDLDSRTSTAFVSEISSRLESIAADYSSGTIPDISDRFQRDLFNTYRSYQFAARPTIALTRNADPRGSFFEIIRSRGGEGQSSFSTTVPGVTRGDHFHRRKVERFTVLSGKATISLRKLFSTEVIELNVSGDEPCAIDMPTMWAHNITNTGDASLYTSFWSNEIFDPESPDTHAEVV